MNSILAFTILEPKNFLNERDNHQANSYNFNVSCFSGFTIICQSMFILLYCRALALSPQIALSSFVQLNILALLQLCSFFHFHTFSSYYTLPPYHLRAPKSLSSTPYSLSLSLFPLFILCTIFSTQSLDLLVPMYSILFASYLSLSLAPSLL